MNLLSVMMSVQGLLESPEPDNALDNVVAVQYRRKPEVFNLTAKNWTHAYADGMRFNVSVCLSSVFSAAHVPTPCTRRARLADEAKTATTAATTTTTTRSFQKAVAKYSQGRRRKDQLRALKRNKQKKKRPTTCCRTFSLANRRRRASTSKPLGSHWLYSARLGVEEVSTTAQLVKRSSAKL